MLRTTRHHRTTVALRAAHHRATQRRQGLALCLAAFALLACLPALPAAVAWVWALALAMPALAAVVLPAALATIAAVALR